MFILHIPNTLQHATPNRIAQILRRRLGMDIPEINRPVQPLASRHALQSIWREWRVWAEG